MGWLRLVGSSTLSVSFAKEPYRKDDFPAKETYSFKEPTDRSHPYLATNCNTATHCGTLQRARVGVYVYVDASCMCERVRFHLSLSLSCFLSLSLSLSHFLHLRAYLIVCLSIFDHFICLFVHTSVHVYAHAHDTHAHIRTHFYTNAHTRT